MHAPAIPDVMLLAAGLGTRLRPLTDTVPKPLVPVAGTAMIDRVVANLRAEGATRFVVNAHHHADRLAAHVEALGRARPDCRFRVVREHTLLDTGGGLRNALPLIDTDPILICNTDSFWPPRAFPGEAEAGSPSVTSADRPLARLLAGFDPAAADIAVLCADPARAVGFRLSHDFCRAPDGRITRDRGRPVAYAGVMLLARRLLDDAPEGPFPLWPLMARACDAGRMTGVILDAPWLHVGDPAALREAEAALERAPA